MGLLTKIADGNKRELKKLEKTANKILEMEDDISHLSHEDILDKTEGFKNRLRGLSVKDQAKVLDEILPEAFALAREVSYRVLNMKHFKVQLMGGITIHKGDIAEMRTGEGKSLTTVLPAYLNALACRGVHVITVNEYLSETQFEELKPVYEYLGLSAGVNLNSLSTYDKRDAYSCDITYSTNSELGFDYLRDNMVVNSEDRVMRPLHYAIIDEVDSILIDEARTPLIISGESDDEQSSYIQSNMFAKMMKKDDYSYDVKTKSVSLTEQGINHVENMFGLNNLFDLENVNLLGHINTAIKAHVAFTKNKDYVVSDDEVLIVDQFTGRTMPGRRFSEGLHQALEAKEGVTIQNESKTIASITYQNFFRMYNKLSGMTGTAKTEEEEFRNIYNMIVTKIPTNRPIQREDKNDLIYVTSEAKFNAVVDEVQEKHKRGQPVLLGTVAVETSEYLSKLLAQRQIPHNVLNAKNHEKEAEIIAHAGERGSVTIATNMAGRGTDIKLEPGVEDLGGLAVIGTERHESRRIDDQLRGRSGRQGDKGYSRFYLSLQDELMVRFGSDRLQNLMQKLGMNENTPIESKMVSRSVESSQKRVEGNNFDSRKQVLEYDEVLRKQREIIYKERNNIIDSEDNDELLESMMKSALNNAISLYIDENDEEDDQLTNFVQYINDTFSYDRQFTLDEFKNKSKSDIFNIIWKEMDNALKIKEEYLGQTEFNHVKKAILLQSIDQHWTNHIDQMDQLRRGIHLRSYAQQNPLRDYQNEGHTMFSNMIANIETDICQFIIKSPLMIEQEA